MISIEVLDSNGQAVNVAAADVQNVTAATMDRTFVGTAAGVFTARIPAGEVLALISAAGGTPPAPPAQ